ncbi:hypothetical protein MAPG_00281 [Magnaporthiopsis poae ATCC 64411]|uniref:Rhodopsin domain-containing protein n=1 Tax=Magnaporthiopsis poae (strain ATCC 64411 / 73-15) TaxID=644358 RepID=A0A0C4DKK6_MAGP6|nr:hypothetical protein MAPG_00281 [Magnaporthiopsis poae ATCC 64411]
MHFPQSSLEGRYLSPADMARLPGFVAWSGNPNPTTRLQQFAKAIMVVLPALAFIFVCLRVYSRARTRQLWLDDMFICASMVTMVPMTVASYMFAKTTYIGVHVRDIPPIDYAEARRWDYLAQVFYHPILPLVKASMLLFLLKLGRQKRGTKHAIHAVNALNLAAMAATTLTAMLQCLPVQRYWDPRVKGSCIPSIGRFYISAAAISIFTDVLVLGLPFWVFLDLQMARKLKIAVLAVSCFGSLVTIVSAVRLYYFYRLFSENPVEVQRRLRNPDPSYNIAFVVSNLETALAIIRSRRRVSDAPSSSQFSLGAAGAIGGRGTRRFGTVGTCCRSEKLVGMADGDDDGDGISMREAGTTITLANEAGDSNLAGPGGKAAAAAVPVVGESKPSLAGTKAIVCQTHISVRYERQPEPLSVTDSELTMVEDDVVRVPPSAKLDAPEDRGMRTCMSSDFAP